MPTASYLDLVQAHCRIELLPWPVPEYRFHPRRKWALDLAWPDCKIAVEVQGGIWIGGKHARGKGLTRDHEKINVAQTMGWTVLQVTPDQIRDKSWVGIFTDAFDAWVVKAAPFLAETVISLPKHLRDNRK